MDVMCIMNDIRIISNPDRLNTDANIGIKRRR